jgi:hypothetical protein
MCQYIYECIIFFTFRTLPLDDDDDEINEISPMIMKMKID